MREWWGESANIRLGSEKAREQAKWGECRHKMEVREGEIARETGRAAQQLLSLRKSVTCERWEMGTRHPHTHSLHFTRSLALSDRDHYEWRENVVHLTYPLHLLISPVEKCDNLKENEGSPMGENRTQWTTLVMPDLPLEESLRRPWKHGHHASIIMK